jgi:hypothetical protein
MPSVWTAAASSSPPASTWPDSSRPTCVPADQKNDAGTGYSLWRCRSQKQVALHGSNSNVLARAEGIAWAASVTRGSRSARGQRWGSVVISTFPTAPFSTAACAAPASSSGKR